MIADARVDILPELAPQICPVFVDLELQPEGTLREALRQVTALQHALRENESPVIAVRAR